MKDLESIDPEFYNSLVWIKYEVFYSSSKGTFFADKLLDALF